MKPTLSQPLLMLVANAVSEPPFFARDQLVPIIREAVRGGTNVVQIRFVEKTSSVLTWSLVRFLMEEIPRDTLVVLNTADDTDAWRTGVEYGASGVHFPERASTTTDAARHAACKYVTREIVVGRSTRSMKEAIRAMEIGVDYLIAGAIYPSNSHPGEPGQGTEFLRQVCEAVAPLPVIAIGGITPERVGECIAAGAAGVAVMSPIMRAADPRAVTQAYRIELDKAWSLRSTENL